MSTLWIRACDPCLVHRNSVHRDIDDGKCLITLGFPTLYLSSMFSWSFSTHKEHSASWYVVAIIVVLSLVTYGIVEGIYIMSVVSFLFA